MKGSLDELVSVLDRLVTRLDELESRIAALEHRAEEFHPQPRAIQNVSHTARTAELTTGTAAAPALAPQHPVEQMLALSGGGVAPAIGKIFLGIAGGYVLRALAESGAVPQLAIVAVALAYGGVWLVWAARAGPTARFAGGAYVITSALILSPMLWELTLRFKILPDAITAPIIAAFALSAALLAWKRNPAIIFWIPALAAAFTALGLLVATRDPAPFILALAVIALITEVAVCFNQWIKLRAIAAVPLDLAIVVVIAIYTAEHGPPPDYVPLSRTLLLALAAAPFFIYSGSMIFRTLARRHTLTLFEAGQVMVAFALAWLGVLRATQETWAAGLGVFCIVAAAACYLASHAAFDSAPRSREYYAFSSWAAALLLTGTWMVLPETVLSLTLGLCALVSAWLGVRWERLTPLLHGVLYLAGAGIASGLLIYAGVALFDGFPPSPSWIAIVVAALSIAGYAIVWRLRGDQWQHRLIRLFFAIQTVYSVAAFATTGIVWLIWTSDSATAPRMAGIHTLVTCAAALLIGPIGSRRKRIELVWISYGAMGLCTLKLLFEDMRTGSAASISVSLFLYGIVWVVLPRLNRVAKNLHGNNEH